MIDPRANVFSRSQERLARAAFRRQRVEVRGGVLAWKGTVEEAQHWIRIHGVRNCLASTFFCPKFLADSRMHVIGFTDINIAVIQYEASRFPSGRNLRFEVRERLQVTTTTQGPFTAVYVGDELFQVGHADAAALREILGKL